MAGLVVGLVGGWLVLNASRRGWMSDTFGRVGLLALVVLTWALAHETGGNGFIAAYVGGLAVGLVVKEIGEDVIEFADEEGQFLNLGVFFLFGVVALPILPRVTWSIVFYAVLSLTVVRMIPVAVSLIGTRLSRASMLFVGWFGPRGLASIVLRHSPWKKPLPFRGAPWLWLL